MISKTKEQHSKLVLSYKVRNNLYINLTNRCNAACWFCDSKGESFYFGQSLKMKKSEEPPAEAYMQEIGDPKKYGEIVFCGFGEPTIRLKELIQVAKYVKSNGRQTRLNTNGHGSFINKKNIVPFLKPCIDGVSVSMNFIDPREYGKLMGVKQALYQEMIDFANKCVKAGMKVSITVIELPGFDLVKARKFIKEKIPGASFRPRPLIDFGDANLKRRLLPYQKATA
jgi:TatD DNase family protein